MEKILKFKTNLSCSGCVASITPYMDKLAGQGKWQVDLKDVNRTLTVDKEDIYAAEVVEALKLAGYTATEV